MRAVVLSRVCALTVGLFVFARGDEPRRFFDFTPVSADNPAVATIDETIRIPLSELRAYREAERIQAITDPASLAQKRALLEDLINEYLYVDEAYRTGVAQSPGFLRHMQATRTMILTDFLAARAMGDKNQKPAETGDAAAALGDRLFEAATLDISNEAYALLQQAAKAIDETSAASRLGPVVEPTQEAAGKLRAIIQRTPEAVLVRYEDKSISVRQLLAIYAGLPAPRANLGTHEGLLGMIKPFVVPELMAIEAVKQGIADDPAFQDKIIQNRNALLRFHMQGLIERQANELLAGPAIETQLHAWYENHKADYAGTEAGHEKRVPTYAEARARVEGDYSVALRDRLLAEKAQVLRKTRSVKIDEAVLQKLSGPSATGILAQAGAEKPTTTQ